METIYTITEWSLSNGTNIFTYSNITEWKKEIDKKAKDENKNDTYYKLTAGIYRKPDNSKTEIEKGESFDYRGERYKKVYLNTANIPNDWELIAEEDIPYYNIWQIDDEENEDNGKWTDGFDNYNTEEEAYNICSPAQYISIV